MYILSLIVLMGKTHKPSNLKNINLILKYLENLLFLLMNFPFLVMKIFLIRNLSLGKFKC